MRSRTIAGLALLAIGLFPAMAGAGCEEIKKKIQDQLLIKEIPNYTLEIVPADQDPGTAKVVGTCAGGRSKLLYSKGAPTPAAQ